MSSPDGAFGPRFEGSFDFTLLFEQSILSILPSVLFLGASSARISFLVRQENQAQGGRLLCAKLGAAATLFSLQLAIVVLWALQSTQRTQVSIAAAVLSLIVATVIAILLYAEHKRNVGSSKLLSLYLVFTVLLDVAQVRTLFLRDGYAPIAGCSVASLATKLVLLSLEEVPKRPLLYSDIKRADLESTSGSISRTVFWWLNDLFRSGSTGLLSVEGLPVISDKFASRRLLSSAGRAWKNNDKKGTHSLFVATLSAFRATVATAILPRLCLAGFRLGQPFLVDRVITFVGEPTNADSKNIAGGLIGATALIYVGIGVTRCYYQHLNFQLITMIRGSLVALIFEKTMSLDASTARDNEAVTLMSADIEGIEPGVELIHEIWASVVELGVALYLLQRKVGAACFFVAIPAVIASFLTSRLMRAMGPARMIWSKGIQKRVSATSNMLGHMKGLKMMGLTGYMATTIQNLRCNELEVSKKFRLALIRVLTTSSLSSQLTPVVVIAGAVFWTRRGQDQELSTADIFSILVIVSLVSEPVSQLISCLPNAMASVACFDRIQEYLLLTEQQDTRKSFEQARIVSRPCTSTGQSSITDSREKGPLDHVREIPSRDSTPYAIVVENGFFTPSGSAEPVLRSIDLRIRSSTCNMVVGPVGSGKSMLLSVLTGETPLTEGSIRVAQNLIAYCDQLPWLRNVSVRDNIVSQTEYEDEWYSTVLWACGLQHDVSILPRGDESFVGSGGDALSGGQKQRVALARSIYSRKPILLLDDVFSALDNTTARLVFNRLLGEDGLLRKSGTTVVLATSAVHFLPSADHIIVLAKDGAVVQEGSFASLQETEGYVKDLALKTKSTTELDDPEVASGSPASTDPSPAEEDADLTRQSGDITLYKFYFKSVSAFMALFWLFLAIVYIGLGKAPQIWLRVWGEQGTNHESAYYFGGYVALAMSCVIASAMSVCFFMLKIVPESAQNLHWLFLEAVIRAPLWFFTTTDSGVTLNKFTQDMTLLDNRLPVAAYHTAYDVLTVLLSTALIAAGAQYVAAAIPFSMVALYFLAKFYLLTSRQMRHLDLEAKSPLYTLFTETINGLATIRAFDWRHHFLEENLRLLDLSQKPYYLMFCIQRWLNVALDLFVACIAVVLVAFAVQFPHTTSQGAIGVAMINIIMFNTELTELVNNWTDLEASLGAVARLRRFLLEAPREDGPAECATVPENWPSSGLIEVKDVSAAYRQESRPVLRNVSLTIRPNQKIGICGRTGSGKSSFILALLRLVEYQSGTIYIDGIDLSQIPRVTLRDRLNALPQDPVTIGGTVRLNLAPEAPHLSDDLLIASLQKVKLWDLVQERGGLDAELGDVNLSRGQQQLFCLARAMLSRSRVVLLDEATSSLDRQTDEDVQRVLREEFGDCTVITVAHRLETIVDGDVVVVMDGGEVVEVGAPRELLEQDRSRFKDLWDNRHQ
ncbi:ABC multidrug transporter [Colletotrichum plurivorum]|uniref:ABC multidrug transporter n=1 Tax=Colletotrichum plurivorum TaxID=2175906 RepID=A0A8H6KQQ2_9PEZI|nr:ABC multidrug transporter [Colletotrichum plurivorum]